MATLFWNSGTTKLANWDAALALFADECREPLLSPELTAYMAAGVELSTSVLLVLGSLVRPAATVLLGLTAVIEIFVYPQAWPTHVQWAAMLPILLCRGPGALSLDHWLWRMSRQAGAWMSEHTALNSELSPSRLAALTKTSRGPSRAPRGCA